LVTRDQPVQELRIERLRMAELPNSVRSRMREAEPGPHPDADLLAAFGERRLHGKERESLLGHLAVCASCREIVALAVPPQLIPSAEIVAPAYRRSSFRVWQWGAVAASMVVVGFAVWIARPDVGPRKSESQNAGFADRESPVIKEVYPLEAKKADSPEA